MLLFVDRADDLHADWVEAECNRRAIPYLRLCTEHFPGQAQVAIRLDDSLHGTLQTPNGVIPLEDITAVWHRRPADFVWDPDVDRSYQDYIYHESHHTLYGLYSALWDRRWVNRPYREFEGEHKIYQLRLARQVGFQPPPTLVTNDPAAALSFLHVCGGQMVYKRLWSTPIQQQDGVYGIYTTIVTEETIAENEEGIRMAPCLFQQLVPKQYELRVNVIGSHVWAAAIYSQEAEHTQLDYRTDPDTLRHAPVLLPPVIEKQCLALLERMGLRMGNIDLIVTPGGDYVFLEINPNGQWAWVEDKVGFPLATALVDELLGVDTLSNHPYLKERSLSFAPNTAIKGLAAFQG